jgi:FkbM family methyltransferase
MLIDFRQLFPKYGIQPKGVLHVGANVGEEAPVYLELGIKKQVWIEANPVIFEKLKQNISNNPEAEAINACISDDDQSESIVFNVSNNGSQSSSILEFGTHRTAHPEVHFVEQLKLVPQRLDFFFENAYDGFNSGLDFLNIDLQGAELKALRSLGIHLNHFKWAYLEVNKEELYKGCPMVEDLDMYLLGFGFRRAETRWCGNTGWGDALYIKGL